MVMLEPYVRSFVQPREECRTAVAGNRPAVVIVRHQSACLPAACCRCVPQLHRPGL